jgi:predicted 3-demethylubiquinone-9 3-methyltransferase (glyoxalase superfamily)
MNKNTICLWYVRDAEDAARFYARTFPDSTVGAVHRAPSDFPNGKAGDVLTVEFTVCGVPCFVHRAPGGSGRGSPSRQRATRSISIDPPSGR